MSAFAMATIKAKHSIYVGSERQAETDNLWCICEASVNTQPLSRMHGTGFLVDC